MRFKDRLLLALVPPFAAALIRMIYRLNRVEYVGEKIPRSFWERGEQIIMPYWHEQTMLMVFSYRGPKVNVLISESKDGELLTRTMRYFDVQAVRGSSSRGGRAAFRSLVALGKEKVDIVLTPDGPRGPRQELKDGVVQLARLTGRAVVPMAFSCSRGIRFSSWDRFLFPFPFGRCVYAFGEPLSFSKEEGVGEFKSRLQQAMNEVQQKAQGYLEGYEGVSAV
ncbi:MAG TPA: lysophospholipid acyltransferase family protein [Geopsychrobacteraceae bacterium]|nr:lysophospholipid acyltransferase family protein [Geopsychrobacteraceae bacterium]